MRYRNFARYCGLYLAACLAAQSGGSLLAAEFDARGTNTLTLEQAIATALAGNPELRASSARVNAASGRAEQLQKWSNPDLELSTEDMPVSNGRGFSDAKKTIGISQTLPYPGKKRLDRQLGGAGVKLSQSELDLRKTELVREVKSAFFRILASQDFVVAAKQLLAIAESSAETARKRVDAGAAPYQEQLRAEAQLEETRTELAVFERDLATARSFFTALLGGRDCSSTLFIGALAQMVKEPLIQAPAQQLTNHPSRAIAEAAIQRTRVEYRRARLAPYPDPKLSVSGGRIGATDESIIQFGVAIPLPILDQNKGNRKEARANLDAALAEAQSVEQQLLRDWSTALQHYRTAAEQVQRYREKILPKTSEALRLVQTGFEEGKLPFIDLIDSQRAAGEARLAYEQKLLELNLRQAELEALLEPRVSAP